jgi:hypothetical protein
MTGLSLKIIAFLGVCGHLPLKNVTWEHLSQLFFKVTVIFFVFRKASLMPDLFISKLPWLCFLGLKKFSLWS